MLDRNVAVIAIIIMEWTLLHDAMQSTVVPQCIVQAEYVSSRNSC